MNREVPGSADEADYDELRVGGHQDDGHRVVPGVEGGWGAVVEPGRAAVLDGDGGLANAPPVPPATQPARCLPWWLARAHEIRLPGCPATVARECSSNEQNEHSVAERAERAAMM